MADLYNKAQYIYVAGANKSGSIYGIVPVAETSNVTLASSSTFRASSGSRTNSNGIIENIEPHILRVDYSDLVTCPSYKFDPERTNWIPASDYLVSGSSGSPAANWVTASFINWSLVSESTSPLGTGFSGLITEDTTTNVHALRSQPINISARQNQSYTVSVYAKQAGVGANQRNIALQGVSSISAQGSTVFILQGTGSISGSTKFYVSGAFIEPLPNGWYRCSQLVGNGNQNMNFRIILTSGSTFAESYTGNGSGSVYVVGAQLETGSLRDVPSIANGTYVTSYISTSTGSGGSATTRNADRNLVLSGPNSTTSWTAFMAYKRLSPESSSATNIDFQINSGSTNFVGVTNNGVAIWNSGSAGLVTSGSSLPIGIEHKVAIRLSGSQMSWFTDGTRRFSIPWGTTGTWGNFLIGDNQTTQSNIVHRSSLYVRTYAMFSQSLSDAECISLTTTGSGPSIV